MPTFLIDAEVRVAIRIEAANAQSAKRILYDLIDCADANFGSFADGEPIIGEASIHNVLGIQDTTVTEEKSKDL